jgi:peptide-methionine (S)-S-oxide reductase
MVNTLKSWEYDMKLNKCSNRLWTIFNLAVILLITSSLYAAFPNPPIEKNQQKGIIATAVFAGGCFWGVEGVFENLKGVKNAIAGYAGGSSTTAEYEVVSTGLTGHAESVQVRYDPSVISYGTLLKIFFSIAHDPTELNYQGPDHGTQYRSVIFYSTDEQKKIAEEYIAVLTKAKVFPKPIVTELSSLKGFYPAESYHQQFMKKNPDNPYIRAWDLPKLEALRKTYPELIMGK